MIKKSINVILIFISFVVLSLLLFEIALKIVPIIYKIIPEDSSIQYIYILGESSAAGHPDGIGYAKFLEYIIKEQKINNKQIHIIHLEKSATQLQSQYLRYVFYRYFHPKRKGIMLLYMGTNNWAKENKYDDFIRNIYLKCNVYQLFDTYISFFKHNNKDFGDHDFEYEYEKIVLLAKRFGEDIFISTISGNYKWLFKYDNDDNVKIKNIDELIFSLKIKEAKDLLFKYLEIETEESLKVQFWYRLGKIFELENEINKANEYYFKVSEYKYEIRPNPIFQNTIIRKIAKKYDIPIFDFFQMLLDTEGTIGFNFFMDNIHPTKKTHIDIAYGFISLLSTKYKFEFIDKNNLDINDLKKKLGISDINIAKNYIRYILGLQLECVNNFKYNIDIYNYYMESLKKIYIRETYNKTQNISFINEFIKLQENIDLSNIEDKKNLIEDYFVRTFQK